MRKKRLTLKPQSHAVEVRRSPAPEGRVSYKWSGIFGILLGATPFAGQTQLDTLQSCFLPYARLRKLACTPATAKSVGRTRQLLLKRRIHWRSGRGLLCRRNRSRNRD